jgi:hypothetical protein
MLVAPFSGGDLKIETSNSISTSKTFVENSGGTIDTFPIGSRGGSSGTQGFPDSRIGGENDTGWNELVVREGSGGGDGGPKF